MILGKIREILENKGFVIGGAIHKGTREFAFHKSWGHIFTNQLYGDYVEFGVSKGQSMVESYKQYLLFKEWIENQLHSNEEWRKSVAKEYSQNQVKFHGLDTFSGMPINNEGNKTIPMGSFIST